MLFDLAWCLIRIHVCSEVSSGGNLFVPLGGIDRMVMRIWREGRNFEEKPSIFCNPFLQYVFKKISSVNLNGREYPYRCFPGVGRESRLICFLEFSNLFPLSWPLKILTMHIQCSFFVRLHLLLHFVGLSASSFAGLDARQPPRLLSWMSLQHLPISFLEHDSCGFPTFPGPLALTSWSDCSSSLVPPRLLLFSELRHSVATGLRAGSPPRGRHLWALMCLVGAAWVRLLEPSVTRRSGSESDSLVPPDASSAVRALLVSKLPSSGPAVRRPVISAPTWRPCGCCPDSRLAASGLREFPSVPCIESVRLRSRFGWACGSTGLTEGLCPYFGARSELGKLGVIAAPTPSLG